MKKTILLFVLVVVFSCKEKTEKDVSTIVIENISPLEFKRLIDANTVQLVDARTPQEFELGFIPNAKLINVKEADFSSKASKLDKSKSIFVYCRSGSRSAKAAKIMKELGFSKIYNLEGGFNAWKEKEFEKSAYK